MKKIQKCIVTTSWDDGHPLDLEVGKLLKNYGLKGTFYVPIQNLEHDVLTSQDISRLSNDFEIGGHTLTHANLTEIPLEAATTEIVAGKAKLESIIHKTVEAFSYPKGQYNEHTIDIVRKAGFKCARTISCLHIDFPQDPYQMWTTIHACPFSRRMHISNCIYQKNFPEIPRAATISHDSLHHFGKWYFDLSLKKIGIFHLWGHSWEIEKYELWGDLENLFEYISGYDVTIIPNSEIPKYIPR